MPASGPRRSVRKAVCAKTVTGYSFLLRLAPDPAGSHAPDGELLEPYRQVLESDDLFGPAFEDSVRKRLESL